MLQRVALSLLSQVEQYSLTRARRVEIMHLLKGTWGVPTSDCNAAVTMVTDTSGSP